MAWGRRISRGVAHSDSCYPIFGSWATCATWHTGAVTSTSFSVASVNVNGIRAAYRKGMGQWIEEAQPDVILLQEVRAEEKIAADLLGDQFDTFIAPSLIKGRAGVGVAVAKDSTKIGLAPGAQNTIGLAQQEELVDSGRWIEVDLVTASGLPLRMVSAYFHSGQINDPKQDFKMRHLATIDARIDQLLSSSGEGGPQALVAGDFNVVRSEMDIKNWKANYNKTSGVLDEEIAYLNGWVDAGWCDVVRTLTGPTPGPYSWWSWRGKAFDNDTGWRIDYHYATPGLAGRALAARVDRAISWDTRFSDHAPVVVQFEA